MDFELINETLHIKSSCFSHQDIVEFIGQSFPYILADFFENENIHSMHDFIINWSELKDRFKSFFEMAMFVAIIV